MAENNSDDAQEKTEEPTQRRIDKAKEEPLRIQKRSEQDRNGQTSPVTEQTYACNQ